MPDTGIAGLVTAIGELTAKIEPVDLTGVTEALVAANTLAASVIGTYSDGARVKVFDETPAP